MIHMCRSFIFISDANKLSFLKCNLAERMLSYTSKNLFEKGEGREKETERNIGVKEKHLLVAPCTCPNWRAGSKPGHDGNQTHNFLSCGMMPNQLSHIGQGTNKLLFYPLVLAVAWWILGMKK